MSHKVGFVSINDQNAVVGVNVDFVAGVAAAAIDDAAEVGVAVVRGFPQKCWTTNTSVGNHEQK